MNSQDSTGKAGLRKELRSCRRSWHRQHGKPAARRAAQRALRLPELCKARHVAVYLAAGSEIDPSPLIRALRARGTTLSVPVINRQRHGQMRMCCVPPGSSTRRNHHGISEPTRMMRARRPIEVVLLPLLGFDSQGHRLGSGAGYYDRWLASQRPRPYRLGYAYSMQQRLEIPAEHWDQPMDAVCTETHHHRFTTRRGMPAWRTG